MCWRPFAVGMLAGVEAAKIRRAVAGFKAVEHRLEYVATVRGVEYYNDSKATNVDATIKALESFPGRHPPHPRRQGQRQRLQRAERSAARAGETGVHDWSGGGEDRVAGAGYRSCKRRNAGSCGEARQRGGDAGDIVLLAPACASFDQFDSYEHRGRVFKELVRQLAARKQERESVGSGAPGGNE